MDWWLVFLVGLWVGGFYGYGLGVERAFLRRSPKVDVISLDEYRERRRRGQP